MSTYSDAILADTPALYWPLTETTGTTATDLSGNARHGTYAGTYTLNQTGLLLSDDDPCVDFVTDARVAITTYDPYVNATTRSFEAWAILDTTTGAHSIFGAEASGCRVRQVTTTTDFDLEPGGGPASPLVWTSAIPSVGVAFHLVLVFNETSGDASLYIDGALKSTQNTSDSWSSLATQFHAGWNNTGSPWDGKIGHVAVYEFGLNATQVLAHYDAGTTIVSAARGPSRRTPRVAVSMPSSSAVYS